ncbi:uncharacterized protein SCHCODRAFT_02491722 [Schizophyllum commune H4-8]|nr:uncharacterized protein SCHCODRAFT_02491722 [Schizophyllum commune H4-8]KAI5896036.1 hypothetical protein SCHCODRAFT_02491722 [Schizophyllum commune H4-8]
MGYYFSPRQTQERSLDEALDQALNEDMIPDDIHYDDRSILDSFSFRLPHRRRPVVQVILVRTSAIDAIMNFHSTIVMNVITFRSAYSFFPRSTFIKKIGICFDEDISQSAAAKYTSRGWSLVNELDEAEYYELGGEIRRGERYVGDSWTWTIDLNIE